MLGMAYKQTDSDTNIHTHTFGTCFSCQSCRGKKNIRGHMENRKSLKNSETVKNIFPSQKVNSRVQRGSQTSNLSTFPTSNYLLSISCFLQKCTHFVHFLSDTLSFFPLFQKTVKILVCFSNPDLL